jgi:hypothetical protein
MNKRRIGVLFGALCLIGFVPTGRGQDTELKRQVNQAIDKGVAYLKSTQQKDGTWPRQGESGKQIGATALAGWTLLECGEDPNSPAVQAAAKMVRKASVDLSYNYAICLTIFFLDKLGDPDDGDLIDSLAVRLIAGQSRHGGWGYQCPAAPQTEKDRLLDLIRKRPTERQLAKNSKPVKKKQRAFNDLPRPLQQLWLQVREKAEFFQIVDGDNSNTQFAMLALWVARRRGLPLDDSLLLVERRFRASQWENGGWGYQSARPPVGSKIKLPPGDGPSAAMTCVGLIGLAVGHGVAKEQGKKPDLEKDKPLKAGLKAVGSTIGEATGDVKKSITLDNAKWVYYFFWTLERMAVLYELNEIGGRDWYSWGAEILVKNQKANGCWSEEKNELADPVTDTCFALLFLHRSNIAPDLTLTLRGSISDPGRSDHPIRLQTPFQGVMRGPGTPPPQRPPEEESAAVEVPSHSRRNGL